MLVNISDVGHKLDAMNSQNYGRHAWKDGGR